MRPVLLGESGRSHLSADVCHPRTGPMNAPRPRPPATEHLLLGRLSFSLKRQTERALGEFPVRKAMLLESLVIITGVLAIGAAVWVLGLWIILLRDARIHEHEENQSIQ